jgi:hypothetical protein
MNRKKVNDFKVRIHNCRPGARNLNKIVSGGVTNQMKHKFIYTKLK